MTRTETIKVLAILKAAYPNFYKDITKSEAEATVQLWCVMFADEDYNLVCEAVKAYIATDNVGFPPVIGKLRNQIKNLTAPKEITEIEAWNLVLKATSNAIYNSQREFNKLPNNIKKIVGSSMTLREWALMDTNELNTVVQSNFMRSYKTMVKREEGYQALPSPVKKNLEQITSMKLLG